MGYYVKIHPDNPQQYKTDPQPNRPVSVITRFNVSTISNSLSVKENILQNSPIKLFPNPASQSVKVLSEKEAIQSIVVYDLQGRELLSKNYSDNQKLIELNISQFNNGLYIIEINGKYNQKFIKN